MSIRVERLTKIYGEQKVVDDISFEVNPGDVLGFLGPNGAGKSTTMKIITCFIPQSEGKVSVCGFDVEQQSIEARKQIGYLPENNPLYLDMYVKEYLLFVASLHKMKSKERNKRADEMIAVTGLEREKKKKIGALSKGYRQRVGLAQAMIHNPKVLIMDEPTTGLDPNQLVEIRQLIKNMGKEKTVILSTHIMQEVQAICNRVVIINKGKIVADDSTERLQQQSGKESVIKVKFNQPVQQQKLKSINGVLRVISTGENEWSIYTDRDLQEDIFRFAVTENITIISLQQEKQSLEEIFRKLTTDN